MEDPEELHDLAYAAFEAGRLSEAVEYFSTLTAAKPEKVFYHYMLGLVHKYRRGWRPSLEANLTAIELDDEFDEAAHWNAGIAATALGEWDTARRLWAACEIRVPAGSGEIKANFGTAVVLLNPWGSSERVFIRRIDPVRGQILNVPLPGSGHRYGDIVLHDGAPVGERRIGEVNIPIFPELQRWRPSELGTFIASVRCSGPEDVNELSVSFEEVGETEDWTHSVQFLCRKCVYGQEHEDHHEDHAAPDGAWQVDRTIGVAAPSRDIAVELIAAWQDAADGREVEAVTDDQVEPVSTPEDGVVWWLPPEDD